MAQADQSLVEFFDFDGFGILIFVISILDLGIFVEFSFSILDCGLFFGGFCICDCFGVRILIFLFRKGPEGSTLFSLMGSCCFFRGKVG